MFNFGLREPDDAEGGAAAIDALKSKLAELRASAVRVIAGECRIERLLAVEQERLAATEKAPDQAEADASLVESHRSRVAELGIELETARRHSAAARDRVQRFREELTQAIDRARDAQVRRQIATVRAQAEKFAMTASLDKEMMAIRLMEERANAADAEAEALAELNEALGRGPGGA